MKRFLAFIFVLVSICGVAQDIKLDDIFRTYSYYPKRVSEIKSTADGKAFTAIDENGGISKYDFATGDKTHTFLIPSENVQQIDAYELVKDESKMLLATGSQAIYRHSYAANYFLHDLKSGQMQAVGEGQKLINPALSPNGNLVAYVLDNNLWIGDLSGQKYQAITTDGKRNHIINGLPDWVYEEEFTMLTAFAWSPDSRKIAFLKFDESEVPSFTMPVYGGSIYPTNDVFKYPKVGEANSKVSLWVYDHTAGSTEKISISKPYEYIPRFAWVAENELAVFTLNRLQNELHVTLNNTQTGSSKLLLEENSDTYIEITDNYRFLDKNKGFLWTSEKDGYNHIYHYRYDGSLIRQITSGKWDVAKLYGIDEAVKTVFYQSSETSPMERRVYSISIDGAQKKDLTPIAGWNDAVFSENCRYFVHTNSTISQPPIYAVANASGNSIRTLENNAQLTKRLQSLRMNAPEFTTISANGENLHAYIIKPANFDPTKQYPVLMYVYGGPGSQTVKNAWGWSNYLWFQMLAQQGYLVVSVDNRGTGARGRDFRTVTYGQLGKYETEDQIAAAKWLAQQPYVDAARIGIFGWSYGGYMSSLCITKGADVFKTAIAVAPVTNWKFYDNIYTERYMGTLESNPLGYDANSPISFAKNLRGNYLLIHGTADDNVHWQNAAEMMNAFIKENKQFTQFSYPDRNHGIRGGNTSFHLYTLMTNYLKEKL